MRRWEATAVGAAIAIACLGLAVPAAAQATTPSAGDDTRETNIHAYVELLRSDLRTQKVAIITDIMQFSEADDAKFWPVYREYETELSAVNDDRIALIKEYADAYGNITDAIADRLHPRRLRLGGSVNPAD